MKSDIRPHALHQLRDIPRCGARTRNGTPCPNPCVKDRPRCRMHGCAPGAGGQPGNKNAWKHGKRSRDAVSRKRAFRKQHREFMKRFDDLIASIINAKD